MIDLEQYKGAYLWVDEIIKELEILREKNEKVVSLQKMATEIMSKDLENKRAYIAILEQRIERLRAALDKYVDGSAYDFDRQLRGEVHFNMSLSMVTAKQALAADDKARGIDDIDCEATKYDGSSYSKAKGEM